MRKLLTTIYERFFGKTALVIGILLYLTGAVTLINKSFAGGYPNGQEMLGIILSMLGVYLINAGCNLDED